MIARAKASGVLQTKVANDRVLVVAPVSGNGSTIGLVALERPTESFEYGFRRFWLELAVIAVAALLAAVLLGVGLARWVARPLAVLDLHARRLGEGELSARAADDADPPEIRRLTGSFNTMAGRLETLLHGHRAVIEDVSHQLRTPLAALRLRLDLLAPGDDDPAAAEFSGALGEVARLSRLVDGLLAVARAENATPRAVPVAVDEVITERVAAWAPVATEKGIKLTRDAPRPVRAVIGDGYLEQILDNLIANAVEAAGEGNSVTVAAQATRRGARVIVTDDGPGMSQAERDRAFRRFSTVSASGLQAPALPPGPARPASSPPTGPPRWPGCCSAWSWPGSATTSWLRPGCGPDTCRCCPPPRTLTSWSLPTASCCSCSPSR